MYQVSPAALWFVVGIILFLLLLIPALVLFSRWFFTRNSKPDPEKATINIHTGSGMILPPVKGWRSTSGEKGDLYTYYQQKRMLTVAVPADYGYEYQRNRRIIDVDEGNAVARYRNPSTKESPRTGLSAQDLSNLVKGGVFDTLVASLKSSAMPGLLVIVIVGLVALGIGFAGAKMMGQQTQQTASSTSTVIKATSTVTPGMPNIPTPDPGSGVK